MNLAEFMEFYDAVVGITEYNSQDESIRSMEEFLMCWLNGLEYDSMEERIKAIYALFKDDFFYEGMLYRGIVLDKGVELKTNYLTSFTSDIEVAKTFSETYGQEKESMIFYTEAKAFDLSKFLLAVKEKASNEDLDIVIEERVWEEEKLCIFDLNQVKRIK